MRNRAIFKAVVCCVLVVLGVSTVYGAAAPASPARRTGSSSRGRFGLYGDWDIKIKFGEREMNSILAFSRDREGNMTGQSISFWGLIDLKDVKFEEGKLSFSQTYKFGENEFTSKFAGEVKEGKLTGTITSDRGESPVTGKRSPRIPRAVGSWDMKFKVGEREYTSTMVVKADKEGKLSAEMKSERVEHTISDVKYERGTLTFKRKTKMDDREWESTFEGNIDWRTDKLAGKVTSDRGESTAEGTRIGTAAIGTWNLEVTSERGTRKQRLKVNRDMSALYGSIPIKKVELDGEKVSFKTVLEFGDRKYEMDFAGKITEAKQTSAEGRAPAATITGEMKTSRGTSKITGKKVVRTFRGRSSSTGRTRTTQ
ncbi:MAG: hypothetical protein ACYS8Z_01710 [Planctomycetota bacterium]|jgi:hypothetical protein